jgi:hypothetical protein
MLEELFDEWLEQMEDRVLQLLKEKRSVDPSDVATILGISGKAAVSLICGMAGRGKLRITGIGSKDK